MKRVFILIISLIVITNVVGQKKELSIDESIILQYQMSSMLNLQQLQWQGNSSNFAYIRNKTLYQKSITDSTAKLLITLDNLNKLLVAKGLSECSAFPLITWINASSFYFVNKNNFVVFAVPTKSIIKSFNIDENAENHDVFAEKNYVAYTIENNLYISIDGKTVAVTNDTDNGIVNGHTVHRDEFGISKGIYWSPHGTYLAYYRMDETMVTNYPLVDITQRVATLNNIKYPMAGMKSHEVTVVIYNISTGKKIVVETGEPKEQYLTNIAWGNDEKNIYIAVLNREQNHLKLNQYDVATGKFIKTLFEEKNEKYVEPLSPMQFLKTKPNEFIWQSQRDGYNHLYLYNTDGKIIKQLTKGQWLVTSVLGFDEKDENLFYVSTEVSPIDRHIYKLNMANGKRICISSVSGTYNGFLRGDGKYIILQHSNLTTPRNYYLYTSDGKLQYEIFKASDPLRDYNLGKTELFTIKAADKKTDLYCRLLKPANFDSTHKYPVIVYVYGGPHTQLIQDSYTAGLSLWMYSFAQKGYIIFTVDNRGSAFRGFEFESVIHRQLGANEMLDQMEGIHYLAKLPYIDTSRIGVHGWSYGGFMTTSLMLTYPNIFKVGVAGGPVIDWKYYEIMYGERYMDTPDENPEGYLQTSLINKVDNLKGRLLLIHGCIDPVVVWQHSLLFIEECIKEGKMVDYFVYPTHKHNVSGIDRIHLMKKIEQYFDDNL